MISGKKERQGPMGVNDACLDKNERNAEKGEKGGQREIRQQTLEAKGSPELAGREMGEIKKGVSKTVVKTAKEPEDPVPKVDKSAHSIPSRKDLTFKEIYQKAETFNAG